MGLASPRCLWEYFADDFHKRLQAVFAVAFPNRGHINCDLIQMKTQIKYYRFRLHERTVSAKFQMETRSPVGQWWLGG